MFDLETLNCSDKYLVVFQYEVRLCLCLRISPEGDDLQYNISKHKATHSCWLYVVCSNSFSSTIEITQNEFQL